MTTVVAALIERDGRLLACQRRRGDPFSLKWEFPGGKVQPGETPEQALARELREELGIAVSVGRESYRTRHQYSELPAELELIFFEARLADSVQPENLAFETIEWVPRNRLAAYDFLPADRELIHKLIAGEILADRAAEPS